MAVANAKSRGWWYILISLKLYWTEVAKAQNRKPIYTERDYSSRIKFTSSVDRIADFIGQISDTSKLGKVESAACSSWDMDEIVQSFSDWGITHDMLNIETPFGALATRTLWVVYIKKYIEPIYASGGGTPTLNGFEMTLSPWLTCLYVLGSQGQGRMQWEKK